MEEAQGRCDAVPTAHWVRLRDAQGQNGLLRWGHVGWVETGKVIRSC
jgi:hypothetical protein